MLDQGSRRGTEAVTPIGSSASVCRAARPAVPPAMADYGKMMSRVSSPPARPRLRAGVAASATRPSSRSSAQDYPRREHARAPRPGMRRGRAASRGRRDGRATGRRRSSCHGSAPTPSGRSRCPPGARRGPPTRTGRRTAPAGRRRTPDSDDVPGWPVCRPPPRSWSLVPTSVCSSGATRTGWFSQDAWIGRWTRVAAGQEVFIRSIERCPLWEDSLSTTQNTHRAQTHTAPRRDRHALIHYLHGERHHIGVQPPQLRQQLTVLAGSWPRLADCMWAGWRRILTLQHHALGR